MAMGLAFWILMLLWFVAGVATNWPGSTWPYSGVVNSVLLFLLFLLLGWHVFGAPLR